jgi:predicted RNA-binding protein (virulence factor B family)
MNDYITNRSAEKIFEIMRMVARELGMSQKNPPGEIRRVFLHIFFIFSTTCPNRNP